MDGKEDLVDQLWEDCELPAVSEYLEEHSPYFTWDGLREWVRRGHSVGLHTHTHPVSSRLPLSMLEAEIRHPAQVLKEKLRMETISLSYPFGDRLPQDVEAELYRDGTIGAAFGIRGFAKRHVPPVRLERSGIENDDVRYRVFGGPVVDDLRGKTESAYAPS